MSFTVYQVESTWNDHDILCVHIVPNYGPEHTMVGDTCNCQPTVEYMENGNAVISHNHLYVVNDE